MRSPVSISVQYPSWDLEQFPRAAAVPAQEQRCPLSERDWQEPSSCLSSALGFKGRNAFQKIFELRLLLRSWTPPPYAVLLNASFTRYWWQWIFQALHRFCVTAQFSFLSGYSMSQLLGLCYDTLIFPPLFFFLVLSLLWPFQAHQSVHKGSVKHADRKGGETTVMLICWGQKKSYKIFLLAWFQPFISRQI